MTKGLRITAAVVFLLFLSSIASANGLNLNGFGARAVAMGGAFVGLADDFTAVFWNPAGLAQFEKSTFGLTGDLIIPKGDYQWSAFGVDASTTSRKYPSGLAGFYAPIANNLVAGIGIFTPSGLGADWDGADFRTMPNNPFGGTYEWNSFIGAVSISPAIAYRFNDMFMVGATLNIYRGFFKLRRHAGVTQIPIPPFAIDLGQYEESSSGWGFGATFGVLAKPNEYFSVGATLRTPTKLTFSGDVTIDGVGALGFPTSSDFDREITSPLFFAAGVAVHPFDNLTITADAQYTNWSTLEEIHNDFADPGWQVFMAQSEGDKLKLNWDSKVQLRFGAEYLIDAFAVRAGYYYDPAPAPDETLNILIPSYDFNVITFGFGYSGDQFGVDFALEYLSGNDRDVQPYPNLLDLDNQPGLYAMDVYTLIVSFKYDW